MKSAGMAPVDIYDTTLARRQPGPRHLVFGHRQAAHRGAARRVRRALHRGRLARDQSEGHRVLRRGETAHVSPREARGLRRDAPQGRDRGRRRAGAAAHRRRDARGHHRRQDVAAARPGSAADDGRGKPGHDRGHGPKFLKQHGRFVVYDAEHSFDGYKDEPEYALATLEAAERGGADVVVLCDTNGGSIPAEIADITRTVRARLKVQIGIHTHDDIGLGVANALAALEAGATHVQGTINGIGERTGNCNLTSVVPNLAFKFKRASVPARVARDAEGDVAVRGRNREHASQPAFAVGRGGGVLAQGRPARQRGAEAAAQLRAHRSGPCRQQPARADERARRPQQHHHESARAGVRRPQGDARAECDAPARQGARARGLRVRGRRRIAGAAHPAGAAARAEAVFAWTRITCRCVRTGRVRSAKRPSR